jgi:hypothetical protein
MGGRRDVVAAPPDLHLLGAVGLGRLLLVLALEVAVVALVEPPGAANRQPEAVQLVEGELGGADGPHLERGVHHVGLESGLADGDPGGPGLGLALLGEVGVVPAGEEVEVVPLALAVADQHQVVGHGPGPYRTEIRAQNLK